ncbi:predicted protein [Naegleria gruberi]|uniref:Predicted protein n=1 Tax=Naegleria gruberi TaxID=5762 RepID=D2VEY2_NAEGR|nr:uncharacterized protein NAEGRDRAFT_67434 [Naegleria gruberi]EFC44586.1 predicted protein [Naegleria gruberi]|eukprot:XP_002677330.1 predicted protein [Naegleria gruberi strain NEG-M]
MRFITNSSSSSSNSSSSSSNSTKKDTPQITSNEFDNKYNNIGLLGSGGYGKVYKVTLKHKPSIMRAVKVIEDRYDFTVNEALKEVMQTMKVAHKHVVQIYDVTITNNRSLMIEMECLECGSLYDHFIRKRVKPSERIAISIIQQILSALQFMQKSFKMVHRDVKPANILIRSIDLDKGEIDVCLADFGFARSFEPSSQISNIYGTFSYLAPEVKLVLDNDEMRSKQPYSVASDIYALGATMFYLMTFNQANQANHQLLNSLNHYSSKLVAIILKMLSEDPIDRHLEITTINMSQISTFGHDNQVKELKNQVTETTLESTIIQHTANQENIVTQYNLGMKYIKGEGCEKSFEKAFEWFEKSANQGYNEAQYRLGLMYCFGQGCNESFEKAFEWYEKSANQGHNEAQFRLGLMYYLGNGCKQSFEKAFEWYEKSANQGIAIAQHMFGEMYLQGEGCKQLFEKAFEWFEKSANQGYNEAQFNLGSMYLIGEGCDKSFEKAFEWFEKSANQGHKMHNFI